MGYQLGIDLGTTYTAAALFRDDRAQIVTLGNRAASVPSVVYLRDDDEILTGDAASRRAVTEPDRVAREFKRRIGDPTPILVGGAPYSAEALMAKLLRWTVEQVTAQEGGPPDSVAVTHPANWGPYKQDLLAQAIRLADLEDVVTLPEPEAAATYYASTERVEPGQVIAVYDLGGGTFDAAVLRKAETGFEMLGQPEGIERLGGIDFDQAVFAHVTRALGGALEELDPDDPATIAALSRLRQDCTEAKEALSDDTEAAIPVILPDLRTEVRITRSEFESLIRAPLSDTVAALRRALRSAGVEPQDVSAVLLVGGSSRIPMVAEMVGAELRRPVAVDAHPKHACALGAAIAAAHASGALAATAAGVGVGAAAASPAPAPGAPASPAGGGASPPLTPAPPAPATPPSGRSRLPLVVGAVVAAVALVVVAVVVLGGGGGGGDGGDQAGPGTTDAAGPSTTAEATTAPPTASPTSQVVITTTTAVPPECPDASGPYICITDVREENGAVVADFVPLNVVLVAPPAPFPDGSAHAQFFLDTTAPEDSGTQSANPGVWVDWGPAEPFVGWEGGTAPAEATKLCALVADAQQRTTLGTGNCMPIAGR